MLYDNRISITYSADKGPDNTIIRSSIVLSIKEDDVKGAVALYRELQKEIEEDDRPNAPIISIAPECPKHHGVKMQLRSRKSTGQLFYGCALFQQNGCKETLQHPFVPNTSVEMPAMAH